MTNNELVQPGCEIDASLWNEFRQDVADRRGGVRGKLGEELENAIREYIHASNGGDTHDRLRRLENTVESIDQRLASMDSGEGRKTKKDSGVSSTVENRLDQIQAQIEREANDAAQIHVSVINKAIEDNAGSSRPTLERYKEMLKQRRIAFEWPSETTNTWWLDGEMFANVLSQNLPNKAREVRDVYGREWFEEQLEDDDTERGFQ